MTVRSLNSEEVVFLRLLGTLDMKTKTHTDKHTYIHTYKYTYTNTYNQYSSCIWTKTALLNVQMSNLYQQIFEI